MKHRSLSIVVVLMLIGGCGNSADDDEASPRTYMRHGCLTGLTAEQTVERLRADPKIAGATVAAKGITQHAFGEMITVEGGNGQAAFPKIELVFVDGSEEVLIDATTVGQPTAFDREMANSILEGASLRDCFTPID